MSKLYNYFVSCWTRNPNFTEENLNNAVIKEYITEAESNAIRAMPKAEV